MKIKLGKTPEDMILEKEQERLKRAQEAEKRRQEQRERLILLERKLTRNRAIVITAGSIAALSLLAFGAYGSFLRPQLTSADVSQQIAVETAAFDSSGLQGYIGDNFIAWFESLESSGSSNTVDTVVPDLSTLTIDRVKSYGQQFAKVNFSIDIETRLKPLSGDQEDNSALSSVDRYTFSIPLQYMIERDSDGQALYAGYAPAGQMKMTVQANTNTGEIVKDEEKNFLFLDGDNKADKGEIEKAQIAVDKLLDDIYDGKDVTAEIQTAIGVSDTLNAVYRGIDDFMLYSEPNKMGYNAVVEYTVETSSGFSYINQFYMDIQKDGNQYVVKSIL